MAKKSLTEAAKAVLEGKSLQEGIPAIGPLSGGVSNPNPVDQSTVNTVNAKTLHPGTKQKDERKADRKSTRLNSSHIPLSRMPSSA